MKLETILNAMERAYERIDWIAPQPPKFERQYRAFRARILRLDAEKDTLNDVHRKMITDIDRKLVALELEGLWND